MFSLDLGKPADSQAFSSDERANGSLHVGAGTSIDTGFLLQIISAATADASKPDERPAATPDPVKSGGRFAVGHTLSPPRRVAERIPSPPDGGLPRNGPVRVNGEAQPFLPQDVPPPLPGSSPVRKGVPGKDATSPSAASSAPPSAVPPPPRSFDPPQSPGVSAGRLAAAPTRSSGDSDPPQPPAGLDLLLGVLPKTPEVRAVASSVDSAAERPPVIASSAQALPAGTPSGSAPGPKPGRVCLLNHAGGDFEDVRFERPPRHLSAETREAEHAGQSSRTRTVELPFAIHDPQSPPPGPAEPGLHADPQRPFVQRIEAAIRQALDSRRPFRAQLHPPELGALTVEIAREAGALIVRLTLHSAQARDMLAEHLSGLEASLRQHGVSPARIDVQLQHRPQEQSDDPGQYDSRQQGQSQDGRDGEERRRDRQTSPPAGLDNDRSGTSRKPPRRASVARDELDVHI